MKGYTVIAVTNPDKLLAFRLEATRNAFELIYGQDEDFRPGETELDDYMWLST